MYQNYDEHSFLIEQRHEDIKKIAGQVECVHEIMHDIQLLTTEQGHMVTTIESQVESAHDYVADGTQQLSIANTHHSKQRSWFCCLLGLVLTILAVAVVGFKYLF